MTTLVEINSAIEALQTKLKGVNENINKSHGGKSEFMEKKQALRDHIESINVKMADLSKDDEQVKKAEASAKENNASIKEKMGKMSSRLGNYRTNDAIDERIKEIEDSMHFSSLSLKQEKLYMDELKDLKKNRGRISEIDAMKGTMTSSGVNKADNQEIQKALYILRQEKRAIVEKVKELSDAFASTVDNSLYAEKKAIGDEITELIAKRKQLKEEEYQKQMEERAAREEERRQRAAKAAEAKAAREADNLSWSRKKLAAKLDDEMFKFEKNITMAEQSIRWVKSHQGVGKMEEALSQDKPAPIAQDGETVLLDKHAREEEFFFAPTKTKGGKKKNSQPKQATSLKLDAQTFELFSKLGVDAPLRVADLDATLKVLEEKLVELQSKSDEAAASKEARQKAIIETGKDPQAEVEAAAAAAEE